MLNKNQRARYEIIKKEILGFESNELEERIKEYWEKSSNEDKEIIELVLKGYEYNNRMKELDRMRNQTMEIYEEARSMNEEATAKEAWSQYEKITVLERAFKKMAHTDKKLTTEEKIELAGFFSLDYSQKSDRKELEDLIKQQKDFGRSN